MKDVEIRNGSQIRRHPFGAHGILMAIPAAALLWSLIVAVVSAY